MSLKPADSIHMTHNYHTNAGAKYKLTAHLVWCPKYRRPVLTGEINTRLKNLIQEIAQEKEWEILSLEVLPDHVHLLVSYDPKASVSYLANQFKGRTSRVLRNEYPSLRSRLPTLWSRSYFASSVGVDEQVVREYIDTQYERPWRRT